MVYDRVRPFACQEASELEPSLTLGLGIITNDQGVIAISANVEVFYKAITHPVQSCKYIYLKLKVEPRSSGY